MICSAACFFGRRKRRLAGKRLVKRDVAYNKVVISDEELKFNKGE